MIHNFIELAIGSFNHSFQPLFRGFTLELKDGNRFAKVERKAHHSSRQCNGCNYVTDGHTFAELKCVSERLNFGECFATKLRLFLFRLPAGLAERSINVGGGSFLAESSFFGFELEFSL